MKYFSLKYLAFIFIALGLTGCGGGAGPMVRDAAQLPQVPVIESLDMAEEAREARAEIRLGLLLPLTGPDAAIGKALFNAATLALFDSRDQRLVLVPFDTKGTAEGAAAAMTQLLAQQPDIIIGPLFSHSITAIKPMAQNAGINVLGFSSDHSVAGDGVFLLNFRMEEQIERVIRYASDQGYARFAALVPETAYGTRALEIFGKSVTRQERELISVEYYPADSGKLVAPVKNIAKYNDRRRRYMREIEFLENLGEEDDFAQELLDELKNVETIGGVEFDAILLPEGGAMLTTLAAWVSYYEIDPAKIKILGTGLWDDRMLFFEPQLYGGWFAAPDHSAANVFLDRYQRIYEQDAPRLITLSYDAVALAATLVRHEKNPDFTENALTDENGFFGIEGLFRFTLAGLIERGLAIYEVGPKEFTIIDPAPENFIERDLPLSINEVNAPEFEPADYSEEAALAALPANDPPIDTQIDKRPFPYNPVQKDAANNFD